ncbi:ribonuclease HIII [Mycoplasmopsis columbinasalis]|uniref:Ribonuclease n=1 Tax=Mycoplasmopsis columbinasalis TaxID=114880 RepID=A0A449BAJ3_9BACT|nr:ribonuclease HIII [Mycoplasmopsis columbinasalis]VEU78209.1 ribonuclease HII [Mycoplasmopsis columbinasalis]
MSNYDLDIIDLDDGRTYNFEAIYNHPYFIGVDETGTGDFFGPVVATSAYLPAERIAEIKVLGVKDSKKISDDKILNLAPKLEKIALSYTYVLSPRGYNNLCKKYNANEIKMFIHLQSINGLLDQTYREKLRVDGIFIDKYSTQRTIRNYYQKFVDNGYFRIRPLNYQVILGTKGESKSLAVAVASIIARARFLKYKKKMDIDYDTHFPFGAGKEVKELRNTLLQELGESELYEIAKVHFKMDEKEKSDL